MEMISTMIAALAAQACPLPPSLSTWTEAPSVSRVSMARIGHPASLTLGAAPGYALPPGKAPAPGTLGGVISFAVPRAGTYRIAIGAPAWIDVVRDGKTLSAAAHGHGQPCTGIAKMVDFALVPGTYVLQLSGAQAPTAKVLIARLP